MLCSQLCRETDSLENGRKKLGVIKSLGEGNNTKSKEVGKQAKISRESLQSLGNRGGGGENWWEEVISSQ